AVFGRPIEPPYAAVAFLEGQEQAEWIEPLGLTTAKAFECGSQLRRGAGLESLEGPRGDRGFQRCDAIEINAGPRQVGCRQVSAVEQPVANQSLEANEIGISGKSREALVRRIRVAGRAQRQNLPPTLPAGRELVD